MGPAHRSTIYRSPSLVQTAGLHEGPSRVITPPTFYLDQGFKPCDCSIQSVCCGRSTYCSLRQSVGMKIGHSSAGPQSNNVSTSDQQLPTTWSEDSGVVWKLDTSLKGWSSPAVWGDRAYMTEAANDGSQMYAFAVDLKTGKVAWRQLLFTHEKVFEIHLMNSYASPSPCTDGKYVWVNFGSYGSACLEAENGEVVWKRNDFPCEHYRGPGSSPLLDSEQRLFIHFDGFDYQYIVALNAITGETIWKQDRDIEYGTDNGDQMKAFCTPLIIELGGRKQLISPTSKAVLAYQPEDGKEIWRVTYDEFSATAQPLFDGTTLYVNTGFGKAKLYAIDPKGTGDVTSTHVKWVNAKGIGSKPTPVLDHALIFNVHDAGVASCLDVTDGTELWNKRLGGQFSASPLIAGGLLYLFDHDGKSYVIRPGREYELVSQNTLSDGCMASPVPLGDRLLVRTRTALYLLGKP